MNKNKYINPKLNLPKLPEGRQYRFHTMIKPIGASCNLDCKYCFYLHKTDLLDGGKKNQMSDEVLEQHIRQYIEGQTGNEVVFSWQGGEPTLLGIKYFEKIIDLQNKYKKPEQIIENDLQTNGTLLNDDWIKFLKENKFHVGLSIDGPKEFHNEFRVDKAGNNTFDKVLNAAKMLSDARIPFAALCVVNKSNSQHPLQVYEFLKKLGTFRIQFSPVVEPLYFKKQSPKSAKDSLITPTDLTTSWSVEPEQYGKFLNQIWDNWLKNDYGKIHVNLFETAIMQSLGLPSQTCITSPFCGKGLAIETNGDVYSCDHLVYPDYKIGNILETHEGDLAFSEKQITFGMSKYDKLPKQCKICRHLKLCYGECPKNRLLKTLDGEEGLNYLCKGLYSFYEHIQKDLPQIHQHIKSAFPDIGK